jgi:hypothetical protein
MFKFWKEILRAGVQSLASLPTMGAVTVYRFYPVTPPGLCLCKTFVGLARTCGLWEHQCSFRQTDMAVEPSGCCIRRVVNLVMSIVCWLSGLLFCLGQTCHFALS